MEICSYSDNNYNIDYGSSIEKTKVYWEIISFKDHCKITEITKSEKVCFIKEGHLYISPTS